jgi:hypothetical protein
MERKRSSMVDSCLKMVASISSLWLPEPWPDRELMAEAKTCAS